MELDSLDVLIILVLAFGVLRGVTTGAVRQIVSFVGTLVAIVLGLELMVVVGRLVGQMFGLAEALQPAVGFLVIFIVIQIALVIGVRLLEAAIKMFKLNPINRVAGAVIGAAKAVLILSVLFLVLGFFNVPEEENRNNSVLYEPVALVFPRAWNYAAEYLPYMRNLSDKFGKEVESVLTGHVSRPRLVPSARFASAAVRR